MPRRIDSPTPRVISGDAILTLSLERRNRVTLNPTYLQIIDGGCLSNTGVLISP